MAPNARDSSHGAQSRRQLGAWASPIIAPIVSRACRVGATTNGTPSRADTRRARRLRVTIRIEELEAKGDLKFDVHRSNANSRNAKAEPVTMKNGAVTIQVAPLELVTLRNGATAN